MILEKPSSSKTSLSKCFPYKLKRNTGVFKFLPFEKTCWKALFWWWISEDDESNRRNRTPFLNSSGRLYSIIMWSPGQCILTINTMDKVWIKYVYTTIGDKIQISLMEKVCRDARTIKL